MAKTKRVPRNERTAPVASRKRSAPASPALRLAQAIRARRKALGLTQAALARYAGCGLAFLYELEAGKPTVRMDKVLAVLEVLGLTLKLEPGRNPLTVAATPASDVETS